MTNEEGTFCCPAFRQITERFEMPIYQPIVINRETMDFESVSWAIKVYNPTSTGAPKRREQASLFMSYCPLCGKRLREEGT